MSESAGQQSGIKLKSNEVFVNVTEGSSQKSSLATIISVPQSHQSLQNRTLPLVILLHGHQSHKNAIYQPLVADELSKLGYCVVRFDFRGQGDSSDNESEELGRTIHQDLIDMNRIIEYALGTELLLLVNNKLDSETSITCPTFDSVTLEIIIAHSRGVLVMFQYLVEHPRLTVPLLVNCCGRFRGEGLAERYTKATPTWRADGGVSSMTLRHGTFQTVWVPVDEIQTAVDVSTQNFDQISQYSHVICVYGTRDSIVPPADGRAYNRLFGQRSELWMIEGADHNLYGLANDPNRKALPLRKGKVNYSVEFVEKLLMYLAT